MPSASRETIAISEFKATCLAVLERVRRTGTSIIVTRRGEPIAEIGPPSAASTGADWLGSMRGTARITGDLVPSIVPSDEWEALAE